ncbi:HAMP domain-containing histidine kinase [Synechococcus sp. HK05]|uniref:sensor histidine kinase n=1 Tax=Synechococcus sp. HK05 TaxID=2725975 RepID=UPI001C38DD91|nr:HAMP domain-containing sensor histidine kinase [Synechococcus sp. HK05]MBV2351513.1 HAMP domain-containing histidine kinase [Synechococcus sp. HK05]
MAVASIRRHLQATSLLAVLAGYVVLLLVNRQLSARLRQDRHDAQVRATTQLLQGLLPEEIDSTAELRRHLSDLASPSLLVWMIWLEPDRQGPGPAILPSGAAFRQFHSGHALLRAADAVVPADGMPREFRFDGRTYFTCSMPLRLAGKPYQLRFLQDFTLETEQERLISLLLVAVAGASALFTSALMRLVIHRGLLPLDAFSATLAGISALSLSTERLSLEGQPSELHPIAQAFNDLLDRLAEAWEHQRTFVNGVSHELRTPITLISGYSRRLLRRADQLDQQQQKQLELVASESESMGRLVNDLLEIARDDAGRLQLESQQLDPAVLLEELFVRLRPTSDGRLQLQPIPSGYPGVSADPERLSQCLTNLVENALKYSPASQPIELALSSDADQVVLHVRDHGAGVPAAERDKIFGRFVRGSGSADTSGHGIGLAVVKTLMERMGGSVRVGDAPGGGADFQLCLPAIPEPPVSSRPSLRRWLSPGLS